MKADPRVCGAGVAPIASHVETAADVRHRVLEAERAMSPAPLGTTDDGCFSPCSDNISTSRDAAFATIQVRGEGTALCAWGLGPW